MGRVHGSNGPRPLLATNVRYWHLADITKPPAYVRVHREMSAFDQKRTCKRLIRKPHLNGPPFNGAAVSICGGYFSALDTLSCGALLTQPSFVSSTLLNGQ
jgi:hypothetical protein